MRRNFLKGGKYEYKPLQGHRSGLEDTLAMQINNYDEEAYEKSFIEYTIPATTHKYIPDFVLSNGIIIEAKGIFTLEDRRKHLIIKQMYPHLDIRFVFQNVNNRISKGSKTTYAAWCERHGFKYARKVIPLEWFKEEKKDTTGLKEKKRR